MNTHSLSKTSAGQLPWLYQVDLPVLPLRPSFRAEKRRATSVTLTVKKKATQQLLKMNNIYMVLAVSFLKLKSKSYFHVSLYRFCNMDSVTENITNSIFGANIGTHFT